MMSRLPRADDRHPTECRGISYRARAIGRHHPRAQLRASGSDSKRRSVGKSPRTYPDSVAGRLSLSDLPIETPGITLFDWQTGPHLPGFCGRPPLIERFANRTGIDFVLPCIYNFCERRHTQQIRYQCACDCRKEFRNPINRMNSSMNFGMCLPVHISQHGNK